jgi:hypothetical protein
MSVSVFRRVLAAFSILSLAVFASGAGAASSLKSMTASITAPNFSAISLTAACGEGYADRCPSSDCQCLQFTGTVSGNVIGKGTVTVDMTDDLGGNVSTTSFGTCTPIYVDVQLTGSKDTEGWNATGVRCHPLGSSATGAVYLGMGIASSTLNMVGFGDLTGTINPSSNELKLTLKGNIAPAAE